MGKRIDEKKKKNPTQETPQKTTTKTNNKKPNQPNINELLAVSTNFKCTIPSICLFGE